MTEGISVKFPNTDSCITTISRTDSGHKIFVREIDLLCPQKGLITKTYEEALFLLFYGRFPNEKELMSEQQNIYEGFFAGKSIFCRKIKPLLYLKDRPLTQLQILVLSLPSLKELTPFFIMGGGLLYGFGHYFFKGPDIFVDPRIAIVRE